jgi:DNA polymerase-1
MPRPEPAPILRPVEFADTRKGALRLLDVAANLENASIDSEFDSIDRREKEMVIWSFSGRAGQRFVVAGEHAVDVFGEWLCDRKHKKVFSEYPADAPVFKRLGLDLDAAFYADIVSLDWLRDEHSKKHGLKDQTWRWLRRRRLDYKKLFCYVPEGKKTAVVLKPSQMVYGPLPDGCPSLCPITGRAWLETFLSYSGDDAEDTFVLFDKHRRALQAVGYWPTYLRVDRPYTLTLRNCGARGIAIDQGGMQKIAVAVRAAELRAQHVFRAHVEKPDLNIGSGPQMQKLLIEDLEWPQFGDMRTEKTGQQKISKRAFERWEKQGFYLAKYLIRKNSNRKLGSDVKSLLGGVSADGRLRTNFRQHGTTTMRCSSAKWTEERTFERQLKTKVKLVTKKVKVGANLQNTVGKGKDPHGIRKQFVATKKGGVLGDGTIAKEDHVLVACDQAGFQLVLAIHWASGVYPESSMLQTMKKYGSPSAIHALTAIRAFNLPITIEEWMLDPDGCKNRWPNEYRIAKELNFGRLFLGTAWTFAVRRGQDPRDRKVLRENEKLVAKFDEAYPEIPVWQRWVIQHGYEHGWVPTLSGWHGHVAEGLASTDDRIREHWERYCTMLPIQNAEADIIRQAMNLIEVDEELRELRSLQLVQVHDEIVSECPERNGEAVLARMSCLMKEPYKKVLRVGLVIEGHTGHTWSGAKGAG